MILPTGRILAVGGSVDDEDAASASLNADLFDPVTQQFSPAGVEAYPRLYHSVAMLLPDATVWVAGSNPVRGTYEQHMETYKPAYLFTTDSNGQTVLAARPAITSAPSAIDYGAAFEVQTSDAANISSVAMMRNPAVTHAFDMDQRMVGLSFTASAGTLTVNGPPNGNIAPPGYYMLFLVNSQGVPSIASMVQIPSAPAPASAAHWLCTSKGYDADLRDFGGNRLSGRRGCGRSERCRGDVGRHHSEREFGH